MLNLGRAMIRKCPVGIAANPFEFAFFLGYSVASGKILFDWADGSNASAATIAKLPFDGWQTYGWILLLFLGSLTCCVGLLTIAKRQLLGMQLERAGLYAAGAALSTYVAKVILTLGVSKAATALSLFTLMLQVIVCSYKIMVIGQALRLPKVPR